MISITVSARSSTSQARSRRLGNPMTCMPIVYTSSCPRTMAAKAKLTASGPPSSANSSQSWPPKASPQLSMKNPRAAGPHDRRGGLHHRPGRLHRTAGSVQPDIHGVAGHDRPFVRRRGPATRRREDPGKLFVGGHRHQLDLLAARQDQSFGGQAKSVRQPLHKLAGMRPDAGDAEETSNKRRTRRVIHCEVPKAMFCCFIYGEVKAHRAYHIPGQIDHCAMNGPVSS